MSFKLIVTYNDRHAWIEFRRETDGYHPPKWIERRELMVRTIDIRGDEQRRVEIDITPNELQDLIDWTQGSMFPDWGDETGDSDD